MRKGFLALLLSMHCLARADIVVVVNARNPIKEMTPREVSALYLGRSHTFSSGEFALVFDHLRESPLRQRFFQLVAGMSLGQVNTYWSRLMFAGQELPPQPMPSEQAVLDIVRRNPSAIGYVATMPKDPSLRTVLVLKE